MKDEWKIPKPDADVILDISRQTGVSPVTAGLLVQRGHVTPESANVFLNPTLDALKSPFSMKGMDKAVDRIVSAIWNREKILVFGDYDVDGVTGTLLLHEFLTYADADADWYIPHRISEGYSFKPDHVADVLGPRNIQLVVTVDCGSDSGAAVEAAKKHGIDVVITDHHSVPDSPPDAVTLVNPKQKDCPSGLGHLAGVGVVFYLLIALRKALRDKGFWESKREPNLKNACDLVALGTIADIVPLVAENRILTRTGIDILNRSPRPGIKALIDVSKINKDQLNTEDIAFRIVPRLNAAGRINHADLAVRLLKAESEKDARQIAKTLDELNSKRQNVEQQILDEIESYIHSTPSALEPPALVLHREGWHLGVLGIVAAKLTRRYARPVILISMDGDTGKGSGRSLPGISLYEALSSCADSLEGYGGHSMAAGLEVRKKHLKTFRDSFCRYLSENTSQSDYVQSIDIDAYLSFNDITPALLDELEKFQPFGNHNPEPVFIAHDVSVISSSPVGNNHRRLVLNTENSRADVNLMAMHFHSGSGSSYPYRFKHLVFRLQWNRWNNSKSPQIIVEDYL